MRSLTPDITESIPSLLSARTVSAEASASGVLYDLVLSGIGFVFAIDSSNPNLRESSQVQKQQIDTSSEAGEQSLDGNWARSQTSWHLGAGANYYEPGNRDETVPSKFRFADSRGVDVWDLGKLSLLRAMEPAMVSATETAVTGVRLPSGEDTFLWCDSLNVYKDGAGPLAFGVNGSPGTPMACTGAYLLIGGPLGVTKVDIASGAKVALLTQALGTPCRPYWVKDRIITTRGREIHQHSLAGGAIDSTSVIYTHPDANWVWSEVTEGPDVILAAGYSGGRSMMYAFRLSEDGAGTTPKLGQAFQVAELPPGEEIRSLKTYLGLYVGIGTTAGVRVGLLGQGGQVQYGPLSVETSDPVLALGARGSSLYAASGNSVIRVNLAEAVDGGLRFPYAYDVEVPDGRTITSLAFDGVTDRVVVGTQAHGVYAASTDEYVESGWLESGDIRYGTTAPKAFRTFDVVATTPTGTSVSMSAVVGGAEQTLVTLSDGKSGTDVSLSSLPVPLTQLRYRLILTSGTTATPSVDAVAVKAVPVPRKQRLIQYPVHLSDEGRDAKGVAFGRVGYASTLLDALEGLENSQSIVQVQDRTRPEQFEATLEKVEFRRVEPRARGGSHGNFGGIAFITVRTL